MANSGFKRKRRNNIFQREKRNVPAQEKPNNGKRMKGKRARQKKDMTKMDCYNCSKLDHFTRECTEPKKVQFISINLRCNYVTNFVFLTESRPLWTIDSGAIDHITRKRGAFVEYRRISQGTKWIYVGNNLRIEAKGIGYLQVRVVWWPNTLSL